MSSPRNFDLNTTCDVWNITMNLVPLGQYNLLFRRTLAKEQLLVDNHYNRSYLSSKKMQMELLVVNGARSNRTI